MAEELLKKINLKLLVKSKNCLHKIEKLYSGTAACWVIDLDILENYHKDREKENEELMMNITKNNDEIKNNRDELIRIKGDAKKLKKTKNIIQKNERKIDSLKRDIQQNQKDRKNIKCKLGKTTRTDDKMV